MADRWDVRAAGPSSAPDHGGRAFARRGFAVALPALLAFAGVRCFQDLIVEPSQPTYRFTITPLSADVAIGDTVAPFRATLTADGLPVAFQLRLVVTQGGDVLRVDSAGRVAAVRRGVARLEARPLLSAFTSDTLRRTVTAQAIVPRLAVPTSPSVDTLTSLGDTLALRAVALTHRGDTIPGVPIVWRQLSGSSSVQLLDSTVGRARAASNGLAEFLASVDTATARRQVRVRQVPTSLVTPDTVRLASLRETLRLEAASSDARRNPVDTVPTWRSLQPGIATVDTATGLVTAVDNGVALIEARLGGLADTTTARVTQVPRKLAFLRHPHTAAAGQVLDSAIRVAAQDSLGSTVRSFTGTVTAGIGANPGSGTLSGTTSVSAVEGVATFSDLSVNKVGARYTLTASSGALTLGTTSVFDITPAAASQLRFTVQPTNAVAGVAVNPAVTVTVLDRFENRATGFTDNVTVAIGTNPAGGTLSGTTTVAAVAGVATFTDLSINKVGTGYTLTASSGTLTGATSAAFDITPASASRLSFTGQPTSAVAGVVISPAVEVTALDRFDNLATGFTGNVTLAIGTNPASGTLSGTTTVAAVAGVATFATVSINKVGTAYTLTASSGVLTPDTSAAFDIAPAAASQLSFTAQPSDAVAGVAISPAVRVTALDSFGNVAPDFTDSVTVAIGTNPASGTLSGATTVAAVAGVATFSTLIVNKAAAGYTLTASSGTLTVATSSAFDITPAAARTLALVSGNDQSGVVGAALAAPFVVAVQDTFGNAISGRSVTFKVTRGGGKLAGQDSAVVATNTQGQASATLTLGTVPDTNRVTATSAGLAGSPLTFSAMALAGPVRALSVVSGNDQSGLVGALLAEPFLVAARDTFGNATAGRLIWFEVVRGGGKLDGQDSVAVATDGQGRASTTLTLGTLVDTNRVTATSTELRSAPVTFSAVGMVRPAYQLVKVSGDSQMAQVGRPTPEPLVVAVRDMFGNAVSGMVVAFRVVAGGGRFAGVDSLVDTTDAAGLATALLTVGGTEIDTTRVAASAEGLVGSPVNFVATSAPIPVAQVIVMPGGASVSGVGTTAQFTAEARDAGGAVLPRAFVWSSLNPNVATVDAATGSVTAVSSGQVTISATADAVTGYGLVTGSAPGVTPVNLWAPMASGTTQNLYGLWGTSATGVYAVGSAGTVLRFNGTSWTAMSSGTTQVLESIWGTSALDMYAVGIGGAMRYSSSGWSAMTSGTTLANLFDVWGSSPSNVYAVGPYGAIFRFDGTTWTAVTSSTAQHLHGIWGTSSSDVLAVGDAGSVLHYNGSIWSAQASVTTRWLQDVWGTSGSDVFAVSQNTFLHYDGTTWTNLVSGSTTLLNDIWGSSGSDVYAVGTSGAILRYDGAGLSTMTSGTSQGLHAVWGTSSSDVFAVGEAGTILRGVRGATVTVLPANPTLIALGASVQLEAEARRASGDTVQGASFTWSSGNTNVATVDANGLVTAVARGTATITVTAAGGASASATVVVGDAERAMARFDAGDSHACGLTASGVAYCWGWNVSGMLGDGSTSERRSPIQAAPGISFRSIAAGTYHSCGIATTNAAYCWGNNSHGRLGNGTTGGDVPSPVLVAGSLSFIATSVGEYHSCAVTASGAAYCWGDNAYGQLGNNASGGWATSPVLVGGNHSFRAISAGYYYTCGITTGGTALCWGRNQYGQLGNGSTGGYSDSPVEVAGDSQFRAISAGVSHTCGITTGGTSVCWGWNAGGQLGDGTSNSSPAPVPVTGGPSFEVISAGLLHTCAITASGTAFCWGENADGQLGDSSTDDSSDPVAVAGGLSFEAISSGVGFTCGITTAGRAHCWGRNKYGQLGDDTPIIRTRPVAVAGGHAFQGISAGYSSVCGTEASGNAFCWGWNGYGQLGDGTTRARAIPVSLGGGLVLQRISLGEEHSCGIAASGAGYCWGANWRGQLGNGSVGGEPTSPVAVAGDLSLQAISAGEYHTCAIAVGGAAHCWGRNDFGQLGNSSVADAAVPVPVSGGHAFQTISAGSLHTCGITTGGEAYCWGYNSGGRLGNASTATSSVPVPVALGGSYQAISAGEEHTCGVRTNGAAYCWGYDDFGQLGNGSTTGSQASPFLVSGGLSFLAISAGEEHTCGIANNGAAYCWGEGSYGRLGDGYTSDRPDPVPVAGGLTFYAISAGGYGHTCAITTSGVPYCWGLNDDGQVGDGTAWRTSPVPVVGGVVFRSSVVRAPSRVGSMRRLP